jgi:hypothetical protein
MRENGSQISPPLGSLDLKRPFELIVKQLEKNERKNPREEFNRAIYIKLGCHHLTSPISHKNIAIKSFRGYTTTSLSLINAR